MTHFWLWCVFTHHNQQRKIGIDASRHIVINGGKFGMKHQNTSQWTEENLERGIKTHHNQQRKIWIDASRHIVINTDGEKETGDTRMGRGHWVSDICYDRSVLWCNFELEADKAVVTRCPINFEFSMSRTLHCWWNKRLPDLKINASRYPFLRLLTIRAADFNYSRECKYIHAHTQPPPPPPHTMAMGTPYKIIQVTSPYPEIRICTVKE